MKQKVLMILICLFGINNINAQSGSLYFGYCDDNIGVAIGNDQVTEISAAIFMPSLVSRAYSGKKITKIRIGLSNNCTNVSVWIRNSFDGANLLTQTVGNANKGWVEVALTNPFTIPSTEFCIGYTATGNNQIGFSGNTVFDGCWVLDNFYSVNWTNYYFLGLGSVCIQTLIDTEGATALVLAQESLPKVVQSSPNQNITIPLSVKSFSSVNITNLKISSQIDNQTPVEKIVQTSISPMKYGTVNIPVAAISSAGLYTLSINILEINGQPNPTGYLAHKSELMILSGSFPRKIVMEERTGTWCGWCIRGVVGMDLMKKKYPDTFIGIAVHGADPMTVSAYDSYMDNYTAPFPSMVIDRKKELAGDPYPDSGADNFFQSEMKLKPVAGIKLSGGFVNANKKEITLNTVTTFGISTNNANFKLAYVLIENGITGYNQDNYYSGGSEMGGYEKRPQLIKDMIFNDVARGIYSEPTGIPNSIPNSVAELVAVEHNYSITLPASIKDVNKLGVVVMLLNGTTGEIENADIIEIKGVFTDLPAITTNNFSAFIKNGQLFVNSEISVDSIEVYNISGQKVLSQKNNESPIPVNHLNTGVYIVKVRTVEGENNIKVIM